MIGSHLISIEMSIPKDRALIKLARIKKRSLFCKIIFYSALTYFLILALVFLAGLVFSNKIVPVISSYYYSPEDSPAGIFHWFALIGTVLYLTATSGIILFILNRKAGFYIFFTASLIILSIDFAFFDFDWLRYLIHSGYIFILGIAHFSKRCYYKHDKFSGG